MIEPLVYIIKTDGSYEITVVLNIRTVKFEISQQTAVWMSLAKNNVIMPLEV